MVANGLADTSVFIAREVSRPIELSSLPRRMAVSVITYAELRLGVLRAMDATTRDKRLTTLLQVAELDLVPIDQDVAEAWAALRLRLHAQKKALKVNDSWIAATAIALGVPVITQDGDFTEIHGLDVIRV